MSLAFLLVTAAALTTSVGDFRCGKAAQIESGDVAEVNDAYLAHSILIIEAALAADEDSLSDLVRNDAKFAVFHGDVGLGPRTSGGRAAIDFFVDLAPSDYQFLSAGTGPFSMNPCGPVSSEVLLTKNDSDEAVELTFEYDGGVLTNVTGSATSVVEGQLRGEAING